MVCDRQGHGVYDRCIILVQVVVGNTFRDRNTVEFWHINSGYRKSRVFSLFYTDHGSIEPRKKKRRFQNLI